MGSTHVLDELGQLNQIDKPERRATPRQHNEWVRRSQVGPSQGYSDQSFIRSIEDDSISRLEASDLYNLNAAPRLRMERVADPRLKRTSQIIACSLIGMLSD